MITGPDVRNRRRTRAAVAAGLLALASCAIAGVLHAAGEPELSEANRLLFETRHLEGLDRPVSLHYRLESTGSADNPPFSDNIVMKVRPNADGADWHVDFAYLSGERERPVPSVPTATGNPIIKVFLQREVIAMERRTGGNWRYFQKAIKRALADSANITETEVRYAGRTLKGKRIRVAPYRGDPRSQQIGEYSRMRYTIVLADGIPGQIYELSATMRTDNGGPASAFSETVTLRRVEPAPKE